MKRLFFAVVILLVVFFVFSSGSEPDNPSLESRLLALEEKVASIEQRLSLLESTELSDSDLVDEADDIDPNDNETDCSKVERWVKDAQDSIELANKEILSLRGIDAKTSENKKEINSKVYKLIIDLERNYSKIIHSAERCPSLGINVMAVKKELIDCQAQKRELEMKRKYLQDKTREPPPVNTDQKPASRKPATASPPRRKRGVISR